MHTYAKMYRRSNTAANFGRRKINTWYSSKVLTRKNAYIRKKKTTHTPKTTATYKRSKLPIKHTSRTLTSGNDTSVLRTLLFLSCLHRHLVLHRRLVHDAELFEKLLRHRFQLLGTHIASLDGLLARSTRVSLSVDFAGALQEGVAKLYHRRPINTLVSFR